MQATEFMIGNSPVQIGRFTYGTQNLTIRQFGEGAALKIGAFCSIASNIQIFLGGNHRVDWITTFPFGHIFQDQLGGSEIKGHPVTKGNVSIGNDVWIGSNVTIMSGITIGDGAVLAANATIVKDVLPYEIVGGNPAKSLKMRFEPNIVALLLQLKWWNLAVEDIRLINKQLSSAPTEALLNQLIHSFANKN